MTIYTSKFPSIGEVAKENVIPLYFEACRSNRKPDSIAFTDFPTGKTLTNQQVEDGVYKFGYHLQAQYGIGKDDVVMLSTLNDIHLQSIHMGTILLGGIVSPSNIMYTPDELAHQVRMVKPKLVIVSDFNEDVVRKGLQIADHQCTVRKLSEINNTIDELIADPHARLAKAAKVDPYEQHAYYCFSSGTSGLPKGVITSQVNIYANVLQQYSMDMAILSAGNIIGAPLPMSHIYGLNAFLWSLPFAGRHLVVFHKFDFKDVVAGCLKYGIEVLLVVPPVIIALAKIPEIEPLVPQLRKTLRLMQSGAAPLSQSVVDVFQKRFPGVDCVQGYGMTEMSPVSHSCGNDTGAYEPSSVGWLLPDTEMRLVDPETGKDASKGSSGELWIRGPQVMKGYLHNKEATDETLVEGGWLRTGDVGVINEDGLCWLVDRIKELIKSKGHQVAPAELEGILVEHENVTDAAVIGVPDEDGTTERPRAYLVLTPGADPVSIIKWFNKRVSRHKRLWGGVSLVNEIEKNPSGKILRKVYRNRSGDKIIGEKLAKL